MPTIELVQKVLVVLDKAIGNARTDTDRNGLSQIRSAIASAYQGLGHRDLYFLILPFSEPWTDARNPDQPVDNLAFQRFLHSSKDLAEVSAAFDELLTHCKKSFVGTGPTPASHALNGSGEEVVVGGSTTTSGVLPIVP